MMGEYMNIALITSLLCGFLILGFQNCNKAVRFEKTSDLESHSDIDPNAPSSGANNESPLELLNSPSCRDKKYPVILTKNTDLIASSYMDFIRTNDSNYLIRGDTLVINIDGLYSSCVEIVGSNNNLILNDKKYSSSLNKIKVQGHGNTLLINSQNVVDIIGDRNTVKMKTEYLHQGYNFTFNIYNTINIVGNDATVENLNYTQNLNLNIRGDHYRIINHDEVHIANINVVGNDGYINLQRVSVSSKNILQLGELQLGIIQLDKIDTNIDGNRNTVIIEDAWGSSLKIHGDKNNITFNTSNFNDQTNIWIRNTNNEAPLIFSRF